MQKIPKVSFHDLVSADREVIDYLTSSLNNVGFFVINEHPIDKSLIKDTFALTEELFNLPFDVKNKYHVPGTNGARGYTPYGIETALNEKVADQKEFWHQGSTSNKDLMPNLYIDELSNFKLLDDLYIEFEKMGNQILQAFTNFNIDYNADISDCATNGNSVLRLIHYPAIEEINPHRARAHNDVNLITLLIGGNEAGLEAQDKAGNWIECNCDDGEIICNIGDMLEIISNEKLTSTTHRVVTKNNSNRARFSIPFFLHPRPEIILNKNTKITADEFLTKRLQDIKLN
jgi:isopenicillin N synthase-like dioxygenase